ncbi:hypothetical protein VZT92_011167 [Zoarces viviparus]|uniref:Uncharacterized protein n=1 Tax=Zoarces viviparus TaxID=48416 RepID=A0AAW1FB26_ZOAVI
MVEAVLLQKYGTAHRGVGKSPSREGGPSECPRLGALSLPLAKSQQSAIKPRPMEPSHGPKPQEHPQPSPFSPSGWRNARVATSCPTPNC